MPRGPAGESAPSDHTVAVTAIEHGNIVITVVSLIRESGPSPSGGGDGTFVTTILGGPLAGATWEGTNWSTMIRHHAVAVTRVAEVVASEQDGQST
jgi:hypothetical protein